MARRRALTLLLQLAPSILAACAARPSSLGDDGPMVVVKSVRLPERDWLPWITRFAEHCWVEVADADGWHRVEWNAHVDGVQIHEISAATAHADERWERGVAVVACVRGPTAAAVAADVLRIAPDYADVDGYHAWPGPNSNTFVDWLLRSVPGLAADLPPNAVGRDHAAIVRVGPTCTGTGVEFETLLLGAQVGLREGVEVHVLGLTAGVGLWPPSLKLPFLPAIPGGWFAP